MSKVDAPEMGKAMKRLDRAETYYGVAAALLIVAGLVTMVGAPVVSPLLYGGGLVCGLVSAMYRIVWDKLAAEDERDAFG